MTDYDKIISEIQAEDRAKRARAAGLTAPAGGGDEVGTALRLGEAYGVPPGAAVVALPDLRERERLDRIEKSAKGSDPLARWLGTPENTALAGDDLDVLDKIGRRFNDGLLSLKQRLPLLPLTDGAEARQAEIDAARAAGPQMTAAPVSWFDELVGDWERGWASGEQVEALRLGDMSISYEGRRAYEAGVRADLSYTWDEFKADWKAGKISEAQWEANRAAPVSKSTERQFQKIAAADATGKLFPVVAAWVTSPRAIMSTVIQSMGATAPQLMASASMPASRLLQALVAGGGSFQSEQGFTTLDVMQEHGVDIENSWQVASFLRDKKSMDKARASAVKRGLAIATFDALTAGYAGRLIANARGGMASAAARVTGEGLVQSAGGATGETIAQLADKGRIESYANIVGEAAAEVPTFLAEGRGQIAQARRAAALNDDRAVAKEERANLSELVGLAAQSKARTRAPARFESLIQDMTEEGADTVYIPAEAARVLFQSATEDGTDIGGMIDPEGMREAMVTGGEVAVPLARYVATVTPELHARIADAVRLQPGGAPAMTVEEEAAQAEQQRAEVEQAIAEGLAEAQDTAERDNGPAGRVYDDVYGQLLARMDERTARQSASVVQSVYRNLGERVGQDAWALYEQFRVNIEGAKSDTRGKAKGVDIEVDPFLDALRTGKLPTDREIFGESFASALQAAGGLRESGGELANMDAAKARPGLVNNLAGMTLDDAVSWAYQEGFIAEAPTQLRDEYSPDAPDINTVLDLLAADLGGDPVYRVNATNVEREQFRASALALQDELDARGVDLKAMDNAAARRALGYSDRSLDQAGVESFTATTPGGTFTLTDAALAGDVREVLAYDGEEQVGSLLYATDGTPPTVEVAEGARRRGIATAMLKLAKQQGGVLGESETGIPGVGTRYRTDDGQAFRTNADESRVVLERAGATLMQDGGRNPRGTVTFPDGEGGRREFNIQLLKGMDASTFMHEMGHVYLEVLNDLAARDGAPAQVVNDMATLNAWLGRDSTPPPAKGMTRIWHGGRRGGYSSADVVQVDATNLRSRAEGYATGAARGERFDGVLYYIDLPDNDPRIEQDYPGEQFDAKDLQLSAGEAAALKPYQSGGDSPFTTEQHEQFARGFEAYLREGRAPSSALRRTFAAFKVWLTAIYKSVRQLRVELTDDVRNVMDRIVASDAEIAEARGEMFHESLIADAIAVGMSPAQFEAYNAAVSAAQADAEAVVAAETLSALQREERAWYIKEKRDVREQVAQEIRATPVYRAARLLRTGKLPNGEMAPDVLRVKLSKDDLLDQFGQSFLRNLIGMYTVDGGVRADEAAALYGFGSGREMIDALVNAPRIGEAIAAETDARMANRHPDPMMDGTLPDRAMLAAHRDRQADVMLREISILERHTGRRATPAGVIKGQAQAIIEGKKLRNLQPATYKAAEAKAGREAFEAAARQDWPAALAARRRQLLNFELFRAAVRARNESVAAAKYLAKFGDKKQRARLGKLGGDYLDQVDGLLDRFDFRKISDKAAGRRASLATWIKAQADRGVEINLPAKLLDEAFRVPYRELTYRELLDVRDAIRSIDHLARLKGKLLLGEEVRDAAEVDAAMATSLREAHAARPETTGDRLRRDDVRRAFQQGRVLQATATDMARELDGFRDGGAIWTNTVGVMRHAINSLVNPKLQEAQDALASVYVAHYTKAEIRAFSDRVPVPEVDGDLWSKSRILSLALNWGNEGNREAVMTQTRGRLSPSQVAALLGRLDARDWRFVESVWKLIDSQWPAIAAAQKRRTGLVPERVQSSPFTVQTSDGKTLQIPGGYYPLKYEADSVKTMKEESDDFYNSIRTGRSARAATRNGHTVERVGSGGRTVRLDTGVIQQHLRDVIRDVYLGDAVNYVHNVINGQEFREAVDTAGVQEYRQALEVWLKDAASGEIGPRVWHERAMRSVRQNFTASVLTWKFVSAALQVTGVVQTGVVVGHANTASATSKFVADQLGVFLGRPRALTRYVREASPYMDARMRTHIEAVQAVMDAEAGRFEAGRAAVIRWGYWMIGRVQSLVDTVTWLAAEARGMELFDGDTARARLYADDVVTRAQGSGEFIDKNPLQRGTLGDNVRQSEWVKATTTLMGYMIAKGNAAYEATQRTSFKSPRQVLKWMSDMVMLFAVEGLIVNAIRGGLPGDDDDDGSVLDDLGEFIAIDSISTFFGTVPGLATMVSEFRGYDSGGVVANAWAAYAGLAKQLTPNDDGEVEMDKAAIKAAVKAAGVTFGLPSSQVNKTIDAIAAAADGRDVSPYEYLTGPKQEPKQ